MSNQDPLISSTISMAKSHLRYLSPQQPGLDKSAFIKKTNQTMQQSQFVSNREDKMIMLDVQYQVHKDETKNYSEFEVRIQALSHEVELWRKRYMDLLAANDKNVANEQIIKLQENRLALLGKENQQLYLQIKELLKENQALSLELQDLRLEESLVKTQVEYADLQAQLKERLIECEEWRKRYGNMEIRLSELEKIEETNLTLQSELKGTGGQSELWQSRYWSMMEERDQLGKELQKTSEQLNGKNVEVLQRTNLSDLKFKDLEIQQLLAQIKYLNQQIGVWRNKALELESAHNLKEQELSNQKGKNNKLYQQIQQLKQQLSNKEREIDEMNLQMQDLEKQLHEIDSLKQQLENADTLLKKKDQDNNYLRKEMARLENANSELRHERLLKIEYEQELQRVSENCDGYQQDYQNTKSLLDGLKVKYGNLEIKHNELIQEMEQGKYQIMLMDALQNQLNLSKDRVSFLENTNAQQIQEIEDLQGRIQRLQLLEVDNKKANELITIKDNEVQNLRGQLRQAQCQAPQIVEDEEKIKGLQQVIEQLKSDCQELQEKYNTIYSDNVKLNSTIIENNSYSTQIDNSESFDWKLKFEQSQVENESLQEQKEQLKQNNDFLSDQLRLLQKQLISRRQEVEDWRRQASRYYVDFVENKKMLDEVEELRENQSKELQEAESINKDLKTLSNESSNKAHKLDVDYQSLQLKQKSFVNQSKQDYKILQNELKEAVAEGEKWKEKYLKSEQLNHDLKGISEKYTFASSQLQNLQEDVARLNQIIKNTPQPMIQGKPQFDQQKSLEELQQLYDKQSQEYIKLNSEVVLLREKIKDNQTSSLEKKIVDLTKEVQRINLAYQNKVRESEEQRNRSNILESTVSDLRFLEKRVPEQQNLINSLQRNLNDNLNEIQMLNQDIDRLNQKIAKQSLQISNYQALQVEHAGLKSAYYQKEQDIAKLKTSLYLNEGDLDNTTQSKDEFINKYSQQQSENLELRDINRIQQRELDKLHNILSKEQVKALEGERFQQKANALTKQLIDSKDELSQLKLNNSELQGKLVQLQKLNEQLEHKCNTLIPFRKQWEDASQVIEKQKQAYAELQNQLAKAIESRNQSMQERDELNDQIQKLDNQVKEKSNQIQELELMQDNNVTQMNTLTEKVNNLQEENFNLQVMNQNLNLKLKKSEVIQQDYIKLRDLYDQAIAQIQSLKNKIAEQDAEIANFQTMREGLEARVALLASEIERQSHMIKTKNDEIQTQKESIQRLEDLVAQLSALEGDARRSEETVIQLKNELEMIKNNLNNKQQECDEMLKEIEQLKGNLNADEINQLKQAIANKQGLIEQLQEEIQQLENRELSLNSNVQLTINQYPQQDQQLKQKLNEYENKLQQLQSQLLQIDQLNIQLDTMSKEKNEYNNKIKQLQNQNEELERIKSQLEGKTAMLASEIERINNKFQVNQDQNIQLQDQVRYLQDEMNRYNNNI